MAEKSSRLVNAAFGAVIIGVIVVAVVGPWGLGLWNGFSFGSSSGTATITWTSGLEQTFPNGYVNDLVPSGTDWKVTHGTALAFRFYSTGPAGTVVVSGDLKSNIGVALYVITNSTWNSLGNSNPSQSALTQNVYSSGNVTSANLSLDLSVGTSYVMLAYVGSANALPPNSPPSNTQTNFKFTSSLVAVFPNGSSYKILNAGTQFNVTISYEYQLFWMTDNFTLETNFISSNPCDFYVVNSTYWNSTSNYNHNSVPQSSITYLYSTGMETSGNVTVNLHAGSYYWLVYA